MPTTHQTTESPVAALDLLYEQLRERAETLRDQFFNSALALHEDKKGHIPVVIDVKRPSSNSFAVYWLRIFISHSNGHSYRTINKGRGFKYDVGAFSFVKQPLKQLVRAYETELAKLREAASDNRALRRTMLAHAGKVARCLVDDPSVVEKSLAGSIKKGAAEGQPASYAVD